MEILIFTFLLSVVVSLIIGVFLQFRIDKLEKRIEELEENYYETTDSFERFEKRIKLLKERNEKK